MDKPVIVHIGLRPEPAQTLRSLSSEARTDWVTQHLHAHPVSFETFETYGFLSCTLGPDVELPDVEAAPEVEWIELDSPMSTR